MSWGLIGIKRLDKIEKLVTDKMGIGFNSNNKQGFTSPINDVIKEIYILENGEPLAETVKLEFYKNAVIYNYTLSLNDVQVGNIKMGLSVTTYKNYKIFISSKYFPNHKVFGTITFEPKDNNLDLCPIIKQHFFEDKYINRNVIVNEQKASKFIREIYCTGDWDVEDGKIYINTIRKRATYGSGILFYNSKSQLIWNCSSLDVNSSINHAINGSKELYVVLDWSALSEGEEYTFELTEINVYDNLDLCPIIKQHFFEDKIEAEITTLKKTNLHLDPHFRFIIPAEKQKDITADYLYMADSQANTNIIYGTGKGLAANIVGSAGATKLYLKIKASKLKEWGINSGDFIAIAIKLSVEQADDTNFINVFGFGSAVKINNKEWNLIAITSQVTYSEDSDMVDLIKIQVDNTRTDNSEIFFDGLTIAKANSADDILSDTIEPISFTKHSQGKNIIADYGLNLSERYSKFLTFNTETSKPVIQLGNSSFNNREYNSIVLDYSNEDNTSETSYLQQDVLICNVGKEAIFRRGIRIKITNLGGEDSSKYATLYQARYHSSWNSDNVFKSSIKIGDWVDVICPSYVIDNDDYIHWSYRIEIPIKNCKVEIINPTLIGINNGNIYDFCITDNSTLKLPLIGKKWTSIGDSLTDGGGWQPYVQELSGAFPYIRGVGASAVINDMFPCWINPTTNEHITNIVYDAYPPQLDVEALNNYDSNCVNFKGIFMSEGQITNYIKNPQIGDYIWWSNGKLTPNYTRRYYDGISWIDTGMAVVDENEGVLYKTINGRISSEDRINTIPTDSDIITIMGGTNDNGNAGSSDDYLENTFSGYYRRMIDLIYERCPKATIIICLFPKAGREYDNDTHLLSENGKTKQSYRSILADICKKYGYLLIDMQPASNFNNMAQYLGSDFVHPTKEGHQYWAKIFLAQLLKCINS